MNSLVLRRALAGFIRYEWCGNADVSGSYKYRVVSRVRTKIEKLEEDMAVLEEHDSDLADELREVVCE